MRRDCHRPFSFMDCGEGNWEQGFYSALLVQTTEPEVGHRLTEWGGSGDLQDQCQVGLGKRREFKERSQGSHP